MILAAISGEQFFTLIIWLFILAVGYWLAKLIASKIPMEEPIKTIIDVILLIGICVLGFNALLALIGKQFINW